MAEDLIRYDLLTDEALRGLVRRVLQQVQKSGLPGEHHFYISFDTRHSGVVISERLRANHAEIMTIVLQHQFWNLAVDSRGFTVELSFNNVPERLVVPFAAIKKFVDPHPPFQLLFERMEEPAEGEPETAAPPKPDRLVPARAAPAAEAKPAPSAPASGEDEKVVKLDQFRKK